MIAYSILGMNPVQVLSALFVGMPIALLAARGRGRAAQNTVAIAA